MTQLTPQARRAHAQDAIDHIAALLNDCAFRAAHPHGSPVWEQLRRSISILALERDLGDPAKAQF